MHPLRLGGWCSPQPSGHISRSPVPCSMWDTQFMVRSSRLAFQTCNAGFTLVASSVTSVGRAVRGYIHMHSPVFSVKRLQLVFLRRPPSEVCVSPWPNAMERTRFTVCFRVHNDSWFITTRTSKTYAQTSLKVYDAPRAVAV